MSHRFTDRDTPFRHVNVCFPMVYVLKRGLNGLPRASSNTTLGLDCQRGARELHPIAT